VSIVNTRSIAIESGFASLLLVATKAVPLVAGDEISKQFGQCSKPLQQQSVNQFISMSTGAILAPESGTQIGQRGMTSQPIQVDPLGADRLAVRPIDDPLMVKIDLMVAIVPAISLHRAPVANLSGFFLTETVEVQQFSLHLDMSRIIIHQHHFEDINSLFDMSGYGNHANIHLLGNLFLGKIVEENKFKNLAGMLFERD
jgi:hypothetical protein